MRSDHVRARACVKQYRVPEHQRNADFFIVNSESMSPASVKVAEGFAVIASDHDESAVRKFARAKTVEERADLCIGLMYETQISSEFLIFLVSRKNVDELLICANRVGMMCLIGPHHQT